MHSYAYEARNNLESRKQSDELIVRITRNNNAWCIHLLCALQQQNININENRKYVKGSDVYFLTASVLPTEYALNLFSISLLCKNLFRKYRFVSEGSNNFNV